MLSRLQLEFALVNPSILNQAALARARERANLEMLPMYLDAVAISTCHPSHLLHCLAWLPSHLCCDSIAAPALRLQTPSLSSCWPC